MRTSTPLRSSAKKHSAVIQCVIRTVAKCRGAPLEAVAAAGSETQAKSAIWKIISFWPANCAAAAASIRQEPFERGRNDGAIPPFRSRTEAGYPAIVKGG